MGFGLEHKKIDLKKNSPKRSKLQQKYLKNFQTTTKIIPSFISLFGVCPKKSDI